jgi:hypothetical protein
MTNLLEPWVLLRLAAGLVSCLLFLRAAMTSQKVLRHFDLHRATEGQLALEKQIDLSATFARVGAVLQTLSLVFLALAADRLSHGVRGAMCAYGVFSAHEWGFRSLVATGSVALLAAVLTQLYAFDRRVRGFELARPLAFLTCAMAPLSLFDLAVAGKFLLGLDLTVVASCCSVQLDPVAVQGSGFATGPRLLFTAAAVVGTALAIGASLLAARQPTRRRIILAGAVSLVALPAALGASILEVAPHAFEIPTHVCPFCLLKGEVLGIGYPLFGALFLASTIGAGVAASAILTAWHGRSSAGDVALFEFAPRRLRASALAWACALVVGTIPVVRFFLIGGGASLFGPG